MQMAVCVVLFANFVISIVQCEKGLNSNAAHHDKELALKLDFVEIVFTFVYLAELVLHMVCMRVCAHACTVQYNFYKYKILVCGIDLCCIDIISVWNWPGLLSQLVVSSRFGHRHCFSDRRSLRHHW